LVKLWLRLRVDCGQGRGVQAAAAPPSTCLNMR
jgi:hypothetical protein